MDTRREELAETFSVSPERMFETLITPAAIRDWYGASTAIIEPREGGTWVTAWGDGERDTEFIASFKILKFDPPKSILLGAGKFITESKWPLATNIRTELIVEPTPEGCTLRIVQELAPHDPLLDDYFDACVTGWQNSFEGIHNYLRNNSTG